MARRFNVVIDCADPRGLAAFWTEALGYIDDPPPAGYARWEAYLTSRGVPEETWDDEHVIVDPDGAGPRLLLQKVPEGKQGKNRLHLDIHVSGGTGAWAAERERRVRAEVARLVALGATEGRTGDAGGWFSALMLDPEGNEFDLV